jgi:CHASE3 domain sensor protein
MFNMKKKINELTARLVESKERAEILERENAQMRADLAILEETLHTSDPLEMVARIRGIEAARR